jgi:hypothetical protein
MKSLAMIGFLALACEHGKGGEIIDDHCDQLTCSGTEFCDFELNRCGDETPVCRGRAQGCPEFLLGPVCACDGPVKDHLVERVHHWPGVNGLAALLAQRPLQAVRPRQFSRPAANRGANSGRV